MMIYGVDFPANLSIFLNALKKIAEFKIIEENTFFDLFGVQNPFRNNKDSQES